MARYRFAPMRRKLKGRVKAMRPKMFNFLNGCCMSDFKNHHLKTHYTYSSVRTKLPLSVMRKFYRLITLKGFHTGFSSKS